MSVPKNITNLLLKYGFDYDVVTDVSMGDVHFNCMVIIHIRTEGDIEKYRMFFREIGDHTEELKDCFITFKISQ